MWDTMDRISQQLEQLAQQQRHSTTGLLAGANRIVDQYTECGWRTRISAMRWVLRRARQMKRDDKIHNAWLANPVDWVDIPSTD